MTNQEGYVSPFGGTSAESAPDPTIREKPENPYISPFTTTSPVLDSSPSKEGDVSTYVSPFSTSSQSELNRSEVHPALESKSTPSDPNDPWYKKIWASANAPLFDEQTAKNWFGWDVEHWNGWGKGLFDLASGLTSPLSIALAVGTFGTGSLLESGGMAALKAAGMEAEEIAQVTKGSDILAKAIKMGHNPETAYAAMSGFGIDPALVKTGLDTLAKSGLNPEAMLANGVIRRTGGAMLRTAGVDIGTADKVANFAQFALDAGFTAQNAYGAVVAAPQVLDAIKEGDYETAKRLGIDALGSGAFAILGGHAIHQHAGELMTDAEAAAGLRVKPSEENIKLIKLLEPMERERILAGEREKNWEEAARKEFKFKPDKNWIAGGSSESDLRARFHRESEGNLDAWHDAVADAAGRLDEKIIKPPGQEPVEHFDLEKASPEERHDTINKQINTKLQATDEASARNEIKKLTANGFIPKSFDTKIISYTDANGKINYGVKWVPKNIAGASNINAPADVERLQEAAAQKLFGKSYKDLDPTNIKDRMAAINEATKMQVEERLKKAATADLAFPPSIQDAIDSGKLKDKPKAYIDQLLKATDSRLLTDQEKNYSKHTGLHFDETGTRAVGQEALAEMAEAYVTRVFKNANDADSIRKFRAVTTAPDFSVNTAMARKRIFETTLEGILKGHELENHDMVALAANNGNEFSRIVAARQALSRIRGAGAKASDGRPMAAVSGSGHLVESFDEKGNPVNPATIINPEAMQGIRMADKVVDGLRNKILKPENPEKGTPAFTDLDRMIKEGRIVKYGQDRRTGKDLYAWTNHDYKTVDNPSFRGWKMPTSDTDGNPVFVQGELRVHPEAQEYLQRRFGVDEGITKKIPGIKPALAVAREAKGWLLAFSPFHFMQEGLRAVMTGVSPIGTELFNPNNPMHVLAAEKGVWEFKNYKGVQAFEDGLVGHSKIMSKIPVLREIQSWTQSMLFDRYIPGLKLRAFERMYEANKNLHSDWTREKLANQTADEVNERFGGISYKRIGRSAATMDVARLTTLAPDWLESEMRFMKRTFASGNEGALARRDVLKMTLGLWATARVLNYLTTGQMHNEAPFGVAYKDENGREKVYSVRTMPGDMLHAISDPVNFLNGRQSPLLRTGIQTMTGRDEYGRKMSTNGVFVNLLRNVSPIGIQGVVKQATGQDTQGLSSADSIAKASGFTVFPYRTEAQKLAAKIASDHTESGPVDQEKLRRHQGVIEIEDRVREGKMPITDVYKAVEQGQLHVDEAKKIQKNLQETVGMDHEMARLYAHATRLPMSDLITVWEHAGNEEKAALAKLLLKKKTAYLKKVYKEMSPAERQSDKTYNWIKRTFPGDAPY